MQCIDVFSGMGGASLGLLIAGFQHILAVEMNPFAELSYMANFPGVPVCTRNLFLNSIEEIFVAYHIGKDFAGLIWLSCPCQGVSSGGNKAGDDDLRNNLLFKVIQAARYAPNAWICLENVPGLKKGNAEPIYERLMSQLRETRRVVEFSIRAGEWGFPQERERVFIIAAPEGWTGAMPLEPKPPTDVKHMLVEDAILESFNDLDPEFFELTDTELPIYHEIPDGGNWKDGEIGRRYAEILGIKPEAKKKTFLRRINSKGKCPCLLASAPMSSDYRCDFVHPTALRHLSVGEAKKLMDLPDQWLLAGPIEDRWRQAGNGVMPFMSELIGRAILAAVKEQDAKGDANGSTDHVVARAVNAPSDPAESATRYGHVPTVEIAFSHLIDRDCQCRRAPEMKNGRGQIENAVPPPTVEIVAPTIVELTQGTKVPRPNLRYFGGKWRIAPWIISHLPAHEIYVEPFAGAASVLMRKEPSRIEVVNDVDGDVVNLYRVLRDPTQAAELARLVSLTPFSRSEFDSAHAQTDDPLERARRLVIRSDMGYGCLRPSRNGFRSSLRKLIPAEWDSRPEAILRAAERLKLVVIENMNALDCIKKYDSEKTLFYCDPPYVLSTRMETKVYVQELTDADHQLLLQVLNGIKGKAVVSGYDSELYRRMLAGWQTAHCKNRDLKHQPTKETLWIKSPSKLLSSSFDAMNNNQ